MDLKRIFHDWMQKKPEKLHTEDLQADHIARLIEILEMSEEHESSCEEVFDKLDQYAETELRGEDVSRIMPLIKLHLDMCRDCSEEYRALLRILQSKAV